MRPRIDALWVLYDESCGFCCRCADWLRAQDKLVPLTCLPRGGEVSRRVFTGLPWGDDELVVIDSNGGVYRGADAFVMALWALQGFRHWAQRAGQGALRRRARELFHWLSSRRHEVSRAFRFEPEANVAQTIDRAAVEPGARRCSTKTGCAVGPPATAAAGSGTPP